MHWTVLHEFCIVSQPFFSGLPIIFASLDICIYGGHMFMFCPGPISVQLNTLNSHIKRPGPGEDTQHVRYLQPSYELPSAKTAK